MKPRPPMPGSGNSSPWGGLSRRKFIYIGAASGLASMALGATLDQADSQKQERPTIDPPRPRPMSVGFVEGSDRLESLDRFPWLSASKPLAVVPAASLVVGDQRFIGTPVQLRVRGFYPNLANPSEADLESGAVLVWFPPDDPALTGPLPFTAWSFGARPASDIAPPVRFAFPMGPDGLLSVTLEVSRVAPRPGPIDEGFRTVRRILGRTGAPIPGSGDILGTTEGTHVERQRFDASFTVDSQDGRPKLRRGFYLLGFGPATWSEETVLPMPGDKPSPRMASVVLSVERRGIESSAG